jgi:phytoene/squalene synthetase
MSDRLYSYIDVFNTLNFEGFRDHPNILIAAKFWDEDRYNAAKVCYKYLRKIDDLIDDYKAEHKEIKENQKQRFREELSRWIEPLRNKSTTNPFFRELNETIEKYLIPEWIMEAFEKSMMYDINHSGFGTLNDFLTYTEGASIAPASIFVHLCGLHKEEERFRPPRFDVKKVASPCAIFSYLVHIIRDFQKDQANNLNYFPKELLDKYGLSSHDLIGISRGGHIPEGFRFLVHEYYSLADEYRIKTLQMIREISPLIEQRYALSLQIIFNLYLMVFEKINIVNGNFTTRELNPTINEIRERVLKTINDFRNR